MSIATVAILFTLRSLANFFFLLLALPVWQCGEILLAAFEALVLVLKHICDFKDKRTNHFIVYINQIQIFIMRNILEPFFFLDMDFFFSLQHNNAYKNQVKTCRKHLMHKRIKKQKDISIFDVTS